MRIISGSARGTKLFTLEGMNTRPTLDRVKESLFNIIQDEITDSYFIDLFSGSGAIGLEAASRGAKEVILCDNSKDAIQIIEKNIDKTHLKEKVKLYNLDYKTLLNTKIDKTPDIIYIDPPYDSNFAIESIKIIIDKKIARENTSIIVETDDEKVIESLNKLNVNIVDQRKYGRAILVFLKLGREKENGNIWTTRVFRGYNRK